MSMSQEVWKQFVADNELRLARRLAAIVKELTGFDYNVLQPEGFDLRGNGKASGKIWGHNVILTSKECGEMECKTAPWFFPRVFAQLFLEEGVLVYYNREIGFVAREGESSVGHHIHLLRWSSEPLRGQMLGHNYLITANGFDGVEAKIEMPSMTFIGQKLDVGYRREVRCPLEMVGPEHLK